MICAWSIYQYGVRGGGISCNGLSGDIGDFHVFVGLYYLPPLIIWSYSFDDLRFIFLCRFEGMSTYIVHLISCHGGRNDP